MKDLVCRCGYCQFSVRMDRDEQVGLLTCPEGHHSFLLDSRDNWHDVIQDGRPKEMKCKCGGKRFAASVEHEFRHGSSCVRSVDVWMRCETCGTARKAVTFEIDYEPTDSLVATPLDPCDDPWLKARQTTLTALWLPADLERAAQHALQVEGARAFLVAWGQPLRECSEGDLQHIGANASFELFLTNADVVFPEALRDCWKRLPLVSVRSPTVMHYSTGVGYLYYIQYAREVFLRGEVVRQPAPFLQFADRLTGWLREQFTSERGRNTVDNPAEFVRLRGGW